MLVAKVAAPRTIKARMFSLHFSGNHVCRVFARNLYNLPYIGPAAVADNPFFAMFFYDLFSIIGEIFASKSIFYTFTITVYTLLLGIAILE